MMDASCCFRNVDCREVSQTTRRSFCKTAGDNAESNQVREDSLMQHDVAELSVALEANVTDACRLPELKIHNYASNFRKQLSTRCLVCRQCNVKLPSVTQLRAHARLCCKQTAGRSCNKRSATVPSELRSRLRGRLRDSSDSNTKFQCSVCGQNFEIASRLRSHEFVKHSTERPHVCDICGKVYRFRTSLSQHALTAHGGAGHWLCDVCGQSFALPIALRRHVQRVHLDHRPHVCRECGNRYWKAYQLRNHVASKHRADGDTKPYKCSTCGVGFTMYGNLRRHTLVHAGLVHTCTTCGRDFRHRQNLVTHQRRYHDRSNKRTSSVNVRRYECRDCGRLCRNETMLNRHMTSHAGENEKALLVCRICGKSFTALRYLTLHSVVHRDKMIQCCFCSKKFTFQAHYIAHCNKKHASQTQLPVVEDSRCNEPSLSEADAVL